MNKLVKNKSWYFLTVLFLVMVVGAVAPAKAEIVDVTISANVSPFGCTLFDRTETSPATVSFRLDTSAPIFIPAGTQIGPYENDLIFTDLYGYQKNALSAISASYGTKTWDADDVSDGPLGGYAPNPQATVWFNGPVTPGGTAIPTIGFYDSDGRLVTARSICGSNEWGGGCGLSDRMEISEMGIMGWCNGTDGPLQVDVVLSPNLNLTLILPIGGEVIPSGGIYGICWEAPSNVVNFDLYYSTDNGTNWDFIKTVTGLNCTLWKEIPVVTANKKQCLVKVIGYDSGNVLVGEDVSDKPFTIEVLSLTSPNGGETLKSATTWTIKWVTNKTARPVAKTVLKYTTDGTTWNPIKTLSGNPGIYNWTVPNVSSAKCKVKVILKDASGVNIITDVSDKVFTIQP